MISSESATTPLGRYVSGVSAYHKIMKNENTDIECCETPSTKMDFIGEIPSPQCDSKSVSQELAKEESFLDITGRKSSYWTK